MRLLSIENNLMREMTFEDIICDFANAESQLNPSLEATYQLKYPNPTVSPARSTAKPIVLAGEYTVR